VLEGPSRTELLQRAWRRFRSAGLAPLMRSARRRLPHRAAGNHQRPSRDSWAAAAEQLIGVPSLGGDAARQALEDLRPAIVILGGAPILPRGILRIPSLGTLNAHPGLLPAYRGVDVVAWAILRGDPVGVTVHLVDSGIDTGMICRTAAVEIRPGDSLEQVRTHAEEVAAELMADVVAEALLAGKIVASPQTSRAPLHRAMDAVTRRAVEERLQMR
jgi:methionyl-tRNA formyltransferase